MIYYQTKNDVLYYREVYATKVNKRKINLFYKKEINNNAIIGYINVDNFMTENNPDITTFATKDNDDNYFYTEFLREQPKRTKVIGYIEVADKQVIALCKKRKGLFLLPLCGFVVLITIITFAGKYFPEKKLPDDSSFIIGEGVGNKELENESNAKNVVYAKISGATTENISETSPYVYLKNDESNEGLYFSYEIYTEDNNDPIYVSDYIKPGYSDKWDAYNTKGLKQGKNNIYYVIKIRNKDNSINSSTTVNGILITKN